MLAVCTFKVRRKHFATLVQARFGIRRWITELSGGGESAGCGRFTPHLPGSVLFVLTLMIVGGSALAADAVRGAAASPSARDAVQQTRTDGATLLYAPPLPASAQNGAFAPDGASVLFTRFRHGYNEGPSGLFRLSLADGSLTTLLEGTDADNVNLPGSSWNAATGQIVFTSDREDTEEIWMISANGDVPRRITRHRSPPYYGEPTFARDGAWIVFEAGTSRDETRRGSIWKIRADGTELTRLTAGLDGGTDDRQPNWSPDGTRILFQRRVPGGDGWHIHTMAPDGTSVQTVTDGPSDSDASWSPDSRWIVYSSRFGGLPLPNIFVVPANGGAPVRVTFSDANEDGAPSWSPDGRWIAFESHYDADNDSPSSLWRIPVPSEFVGGS
jgi:TolB protein